MKSADPRAIPVYRVRVTAPDFAEATALAEALLDVPLASDDDVARLVVSTTTPEDEADAHVVVSGASAPTTTKPVFLVRRGEIEEDASPSSQNPPREFVVGPKLEGIDILRAALLDEALRHLGVTVDRARRAKRPFATGIIAGAALVTGAEGVLPGAAAFVVGTQITAIMSLYYLYTGKWMGRTQALALLPVFATEAAGGSLFLLAKSFFPPTGVGDAAAVVVAASMTVAMLGAVAVMLEQGYSLDEKEALRRAFQKMRAKTKAERSRLVRNRHRWKDKNFFRDLVKRLVFD